MARNADAQRKDGQAPPDWARRTDVGPSDWRAGGSAGPRVTIVGPCAAGKTTLVTRLQARGYDAHAVAQEHSGVPYLWQLSEPDLLVFLDVDLAATTARRQREWPAALHDTQQSRLAHARAHADFYLDSSPLTPDTVAERVAGFIQGVTSRTESQV